MDEARLITELGLRIRQARQAARMNGQELAARIGMSQSYISEIERGNRSPALSTLAMIASALDKPMSYFLPETGQKEPETSTFATEFGHIGHDFAHLLRESMDKTHMSLDDLASASGLSRLNVSRILRGYTPARPLVLRIAEALHENPNRLLISAGYIPKDPAHQNLMRLVAEPQMQLIVAKIAAEFKTQEEREYLLSLIDDVKQRQEIAN